MRDYILEIARYLYRDNPNVGIDEIAAIGGIKSTHILDYFPSNAALHAALDEKATRGVGILVGK
jgi:UTP-glucose-1-phosphate uridylyltransferase